MKKEVLVMIMENYSIFFAFWTWFMHKYTIIILWYISKYNSKLTFYVHCAKEWHKLECLKENRNVFVEIDRGESLITADIPCKYGAEYESVMCRDYEEKSVNNNLLW